MNDHPNAKYASFYGARRLALDYPVDFVARAVQCGYPHRALDRETLKGGMALEIGWRRNDRRGVAEQVWLVSCARRRAGRE